MADDVRRLVWSSSAHAIVEDGPRLEFHRRLFSELWIAIPVHMMSGGLGIALLMGTEPWAALFMLLIFVYLIIKMRPDPLHIGMVTPLARLDRRLGVIDLGDRAVARLDEIEASLVHDTDIDAIEIQGPDFHVRIVEMPPGASERLVIELRALGLPMRGDADSYRTGHEPRIAR